MPYIGKPQSADAFRVTPSNIDSELKLAVSGSNDSEMALATASIAAITASISRLNDEISTDDTDMTLATASIAAITASISRLDTEVETNESNMTLATASIAAITSSISTINDNMTLATASIAAITASLGQPVNTDSDVTFGTITSGDITSTGTITAVEVHTTFVSSSIAVISGSNNFGDATDDHHSFTGSLSVSGSGTVTGSFTVNGDLVVKDNIDLEGDIDVNGTTNLDVVDIDGAVDITTGIDGYAMQMTNVHDGSEGLLVRTTDNDTGEYILRLQSSAGATDTNYLDRLVVNKSGNVGIGTTAPSGSLHLSTTGTQIMYLEGDSNNSGQEDCYIKFLVDGQSQEAYVGWDNNNSSTLFSGNLENTFVMGTKSNLPVLFATNNTERMMIRVGLSVKGAFVNSVDNNPDSYQISLGGDDVSNPRWGFRVSDGSDGEHLYLDRNLNVAGRANALKIDKSSGNATFAGYVTATRFSGVGSALTLTSGANAIVTIDAGNAGVQISDLAKVGGPTGGYKGAGTLNAIGVYDDNVLLSCYVFDQAVNGAIDNNKWDDKVLDRPKGTDGKSDYEARSHQDMRKFKERIGTDTDPLDIDKYSKHWKDKKHLTSMPNEEKFNLEEGMTVGSWVQRLIETVEIQAVHISNLNDRIKVLES